MKTSHKKPIIIFSIVTILIVATFIGGFIFFRQQQNHSQDTTSDSNVTPGTEPPYNFDYSWLENHPYIAHAFGGILGHTYTNSYEAFLLNYQLGHRIFEVDFSLTEDDYTVAAHDKDSWQQNSSVNLEKKTTEAPAFTYDSFKSSLWFNQFTPVDLKNLFEIMQKYPDIYIVTDTKYYDAPNVKKQFAAFIETAKKFDPKLLDRFIIQIYKPEMLDQIMAIYPWKSVLYTLYANWGNWTPENVIEFANQSGVRFITIPAGAITPELAEQWKAANLYIAAHTIDDLSFVKQLRSLGVDDIYTNFLIP